MTIIYNRLKTSKILLSDVMNDLNKNEVIILKAKEKEELKRSSWSKYTWSLSLLLDFQCFCSIINDINHDIYSWHHSWQMYWMIKVKKSIENNWKKQRAFDCFCNNNIKFLDWIEVNIKIFWLKRCSFKTR